MNRRALLLTLGSLLIALAVFSLAVVIAQRQRGLDERAAALAGFERTAALHDGIASGFAEIFNTTAGITIRTTNQTIAFTEQLPNGNNAAFSSAVLSWESFIESNDSAATIAPGTLASILTIGLLPHGVNYSHDSFGGNQLRVLASAVPGNRYDINISIAANVTACTESITAGTFELVVFVDGAGSNDCTKSLIVTPTANNRLAISTDTGAIDIDLNASRLFITSSASVSAVTTQLWYNRTGLARNEARLLPEGLIRIGVERLKLTRTGTAIVATW